MSPRETRQISHADDPLPAPSTSRPPRPYRSRARSRGGMSSRASSSASSRASSATRSGPSNFGSLASIATNDPVNIAAAAYGGLTMDGRAGPSSSSGSQMQTDASMSSGGKKRVELAAAESSTSGRAKKRRRVSLEGVVVDVSDMPSDGDIEHIPSSSLDAEMRRIFDQSRPTAHVDSLPQTSRTLPAQSPDPLTLQPEPIDVDAFFSELPLAGPSFSSTQPAAPSSVSPHVPESMPAPGGDTIDPLSAYTCPICFCPPTYATLTPCGHVCCGECIFTAVKTSLARTMGMMPREANLARCPVCRATIPGWDGKGGGVIGLKPRTVLSL